MLQLLLLSLFMRFGPVFLFILSPIIAFCQRTEHAYDLAVKKIVNKSWAIEKICYNDSCYTNENTINGDAPHNHFFYYGEQIDGRKTTWHEKNRFLEQTVGMIEYPTKPLKYSVISCQPIISFIDSDTHKKSVFAIWAGGMGPEKGTLTFLSDSTFVVDPLYSKKIYYKLMETPVDFYRLYEIDKH